MSQGAPRPLRLLRNLGDKVRSARLELEMSQRDLASAAQVSERFIALVEAGDGNPSIVKLDQIARALHCSMAEILAAVEHTGPKKVITLLGLRGAGKTTIGRLAAKQLGVPFIELDQRVSERAQLPLATLFEVHGEPYFRRLEHEELKAVVSANQHAVVATSGSIVTSRETFSLLLSQTVSIWLHAKPEDHWTRVIAQGDRRPMDKRQDAMDDLRKLLRTRNDLYGQSDLRIDTHGRSIDDVSEAIVRFVHSKARVFG